MKHGDIVTRLQSLGYMVTDADKWLIGYLIGKVANEIRNECNVDSIPKGLHQIAVDMVCGEFLMMKKGSGQLEDFDVAGAVKQIKQGDTDVTYAIGDDSITAETLIHSLMTGGRAQFARFRRLVW